MIWLVSAVVVGCVPSVGPGVEPGEGSPIGADPAEVDPGAHPSKPGGTVPDIRCAEAPDAGEAGSFHHGKNVLISLLGDPRHRGLDLMASAGAAGQTLEGWISYTLVDKALEDEDVEVFACSAGRWQRIGTARTDDEGHFTLGLLGDAQLPIGMRDLFVSVVGDRTGARFLGYVAPTGTPLVVSDVDGTLTSSENEFLETVVLGGVPGVRAGAARALGAAAAAGRQVVYVTARGNQYTGCTRDWLDANGFPRGPVRLSPSFLTLPGGDTIDYKVRTLAALSGVGFALSAGVGNRASDVTAYATAGVDAARIFVELPEFGDELQPLVDAGHAVGFSSYDELLGKL